jgi:zinc transport system substrate-binding protein
MRGGSGPGPVVARGVGIGALGFLLALSGTSCAGGPETSSEAVPTVLVSVPPEAYLVRSIAGHRVSARVLLPPGSSPHTYEPSIGQARLAAAAGLYLSVGHPRLFFESAWEKALTGRGETRVVPLAAGCEARPDDPHVWLSLACTRAMAIRAEEALRSLLPADDSAALRAGLDSTLSELDRASREADSLLAPYRGRSFLVFHPAWAYFARDHGLKQVAVQAGSREPGPRDLARVLAKVREENLRVMFIQPGMPHREADRIARELGVRSEVLDPLEEDWPELVVGAARTLRSAWRP